MVRCWNFDPDFRPPFENLRQRMDSYIRDTTYLEVINMDQYDSSKYTNVEDLGGDDNKEQVDESKGKKSRARRWASERK
ncbi:hypothetical protein OS493_028487 [Desmophyllum pertusum]|uniref:Uncharacterized protein n=1 Tax=Desmophyllum pertusum TaxID=174260 RepID=A0A9X0CXX5_9CNID|nr:hypothetical protein OS493_028487 [Desmophyllum pertusum]